MTAIPVHLVGDGIDWPAWLQAVGSLVGIAIAIFVPAWIETDRRKSEERAIAQKRIAAFRALEAVVDAVGNKGLCLPGEIEGAVSALDGLDLSVFTQEALVALVKVRSRIGTAAAFVSANSGRNANMPVGSDFNAGLAREDLRACGPSMGVVV